MAKVRGGLFSLGASGKLAKTLVYSKWKAEPYAREYVTPANPRTPAQVAQRDTIKQAIEYWQLPELVNAVRQGMRRAASRLSASMSGANLATRGWCALKKAVADSNITTSGVVVYGGSSVTSLAVISGATVSGTLGMGLALSYASTGTTLTITGAADNAGSIDKTKSLTIVKDITGYEYIRVVAVTTDGSDAIDLTGIVAVSDIPVA